MKTIAGRCLVVWVITVVEWKRIMAKGIGKWGRETRTAAMLLESIVRSLIQLLKHWLKKRNALQIRMIKLDVACSNLVDRIPN